MRFADVAVVGAGPAGVAAAVTLARAGRDVVVVDKATFPRDKCCGDGLTTGALRELEGLGLDPSAVSSWQAVHDVVVRSPSGRETSFPLPGDGGAHAAVARRLELDAALVDLARRAGATVVEGAAVVGATAGADRVELAVAGSDDVVARYVVGADGTWSPLRRHLGLEAGARRLGEWHAMRQYFAHVGPRASRELFVWFEPDLLPGYAWSFPVAGGGANVGFGIQRGGPLGTGEMGGCWRDLLDRPHVRAVLGEEAQPEGPPRAWPIPAHVEEATLAAGGGRALFVGDAAAATDPLTGEGIGQALLTGRLAATAILGAGALRADLASRRYRQAVARELVADARMSKLLIGAVRRPLGVQAGLRLAGATAWTRRNFARWLFEDYPRAYLATPGRWSEHALAGEGAWARCGGGQGPGAVPDPEGSPAVHVAVTAGA